MRLEKCVAVLAGRHILAGFEQAQKVFFVLVSHRGSDLFDGQIGADQQHLALFDALSDDVLFQGHAAFFEKERGEVMFVVLKDVLDVFQCLVVAEIGADPTDDVGQAQRMGEPAAQVEAVEDLLRQFDQDLDDGGVRGKGGIVFPFADVDELVEQRLDGR